MRRVALAGLLAAHPRVLILDEPMAGLDRESRDLLVSVLKERRRAGLSILVISHDLEGMDSLCDTHRHLSQGVLCCAACRGRLGGGVSMPLSPGALAAARYIVSGPPKKLFSFALAEESLRRLGQATEAFLMTQQERGFRTLDYYKQLERSLPEAGRG